ncbi:hypothetical protein PG988_008283 [Apiospora saccharicola]
MAYDTFPFHSMQQPVYHSTDHMGEVIDPSLRYSPFASFEPTAYYSQGFPRGPMPPNNTPYFINHAWGSHQPDGVTTPIHSQPPLMFARQETPSDEHSSSASGSEHTPSTPPDETTYCFHNQCDPWSSQTHSQMVQMTGMSDGVKLGDVNSLDDELQGFPEEKMTELPLRGYTMSSIGSNLEMDHMGPTEPIHLMRQDSPTAITPPCQGRKLHPKQLSIS